MSLLASRASLQASRSLARPQRRTFLNWMTNYPDKIVEMKKAHQAGGRSVFTWQKQSGDAAVTMAGVGLTTIGLLQLTTGYYRLATGKGKLD